MSAPIDLSKPHNYLLVDGPAPSFTTHYLDRYTGEPTTLCGQPANLTEVETDPLGYLAGVQCDACRAELERRVLTPPLPNGGSRELAERALALYDVRMRGGYKNQQIAARDRVRLVSGMGVRELRRWLADNPVGT